jgi:exonuclease SbcC
MKILHITDSHGTVKGPESRKDIYYITFLKKMYELGYVVKRYGIDMVIHTGDLFHTARVSDKFAGQVSEMIKAMGVPFYVVPGNHDIEGYTIDTIDQTKLGLLAKAGVVTILDREHPVSISAYDKGEPYTVAISGQEYYAHIDEGNVQDFEMQQDEADLNILAVHAYLTSTPQHPDIKCTMCQNVISNADIILTGHYHRQFEWSDGQSLDIFNPGSMMRVEQTDYNKTHMPMYGILEIGLNDAGYVEWDYKFHEFRVAEPSTVIFDYSAKYKAKHTSITLDGFKNSLSTTMSQMNGMSTNIQTIIQNICAGASVPPHIEQKALNVYNTTLQTIPDEFEAPTGFIESPKHKKISKVIIKNFQSHEDTTLEFNKGLNIIVGESNNGKTAILRAIMWVIDNQPLGTDFIMAGKDECSVTIAFDDGTSIKRGRTRKDTGYYDIYYYDENGTLQRGQYRGFTNAVPIEVANVHQMPKVNITKDIETHLNVLSQLDPPFLITESPMVKASAIGRITGTHVLDTGVKETNKTIQSNKKTVKVYAESLAEKEAELKALPDIVLLEKFSKMYHKIYEHLSINTSRLVRIETDYESAKGYDIQIISAARTKSEKQAFANMMPVILDAQMKSQRCLQLSTKIDNCTNVSEQIEHNKKIMDRCELFATLKPIIEFAQSRIRNIQYLENQLNNVQNCTSSITATQNIQLMAGEFVKHTKGIIAYCNILHNFISKVFPKMESFTSLSNMENDMLTDYNGHKKFVKIIKTNMTKLSKERSKFILDNGVCPCCGQSVTETVHTESIIQFFKEDDHENI